MEGQSAIDKTQKRARRFCEHCNKVVSHTLFYEHKRKFLRNGVWTMALTDDSTENNIFDKELEHGLCGEAPVASPLKVRHVDFEVF